MTSYTMLEPRSLRRISTIYPFTSLYFWCIGLRCGLLLTPLPCLPAFGERRAQRGRCSELEAEILSRWLTVRPPAVRRPGGEPVIPGSTLDGTLRDTCPRLIVASDREDKLRMGS